ncbi:MAG TPA: translation initiation factor IF-2, partial [bacterium]|nr:translation initiation factor IF-2 [bacterium]
GGITQRIGAHEVQLEKGSITFIDTPGHEAFTEMRARGSQVTDIVVLVIAADDGVMPQTRESIDHARAAGVEIVVALNKIDKPNANPDMVKKQLAELELLPEDWGGQTIVVPTAAKKGEGIKQLLEAILLQAEMMELKANPNRSAEGVVIEARLDKGMGPVATIIVQKGTLKIGDNLVAGTSYGRIRSMKDPRGNTIQSALPGHAVEVHGLNSVPMAGEKFNCLTTDDAAKELVEHRLDEIRKQTSPETKKSVTLDDIMKGICSGETKDLKLIVKADTQGSVEALKASLENLTDQVVAVKVILAGTGGVTSNDVNLALASGAVIIAFNVRPDSKALEEAQTSKVDIKFYDVIYNCLEDMEKVKLCMLDPTEVEKVNGQAEVRQIFNVSRIGTIAGCGVKSGKIVRNSMVRVIRDGAVVYTGKLKSLKRFKDDAKEVAAGLECGMSVEG